MDNTSDPKIVERLKGLPPYGDEPKKEEEAQEPQEQPKERTTQQFEKLKESNQELKQERDTEKEEKERIAAEKETLAQENAALTDVLTALNSDTFTPDPTVNATPSFVPPAPQNNVDLFDEAGYVNREALESQKKEIQEARLRAERAEKIAQYTVQQMASAQEAAQIATLHQNFPQVDPKSPEFDPVFYKAVKNELMGQMVNGKRDALVAAAEVTKWYQPMNKQQSQEIKNQKQEINAVTGGTRVASTADSDDYAKMLTDIRNNKKGAIAAALKARGF